MNHLCQSINKKAREYVDICLRNADRLESLVQDILDVSKLEAGEMKFEMQQVNLVLLMHNTIIDISSLAKEKNLSLNSNLPKTLPSVYADPQRISQVISNLIKNAIKFTDKGSVKISAKVSGHNIQVEVADTGVGIKKEDLPRMFTKFFQAEDVATRKTKGTGLGLAICKEIIEKHNGKIWVESEFGKGSSVYFNLPIER